MKNKNLITTLVFCMISAVSTAQFFYESVGTGTSTAISQYSGWDNTSPVVYTDFQAFYNSGIINSDPSNYEGASGASCVRVGGGGSTFTISGINTVGHPFLLLSFGNKCNFPNIDSVHFHYSEDGGASWTSLPISGIKAYAWGKAQANDYLPQAEDLHLRWTINTDLSWKDYKIDDITLEDDDVSDPVIITSTLGLSFEDVSIGNASAEKFYTLEGYNLTSDITLTPPLGFQVSLTPETGFTADPLVLGNSAGTVNNTNIYVKFTPTEVKEYTGVITHASAGANQPGVDLTGSGLSNQPTIIVENLNSFGSQALNTYSAEQSYMVEAYNLPGDVVVVPPSAFEISTGSKIDFVPTNPLILTVNDGKLEPTEIFVRFKPLSVETYNGNITHTSGSTTENVAVTGTGSVKQKYLARIVDYGADLGEGYYRDKSVTLQPGVHVDVDGDGSSSDDGVAFWEFSLTEPMNPSHIYFDEEAPSARFFGGITAYFDKPGQSVTEGLINENHELRDDFNMMVVQSDNNINKKAYGVWFWKKENFLNGGDNPENTISLDENSLIAVHISRYWSGLEGGRFLISDQGQFYLSEQVFSGLRTSHMVVPTETRWAPYNPAEPYEIQFDPETANWQQIAFNHVDAVGFYLFKNTLDNSNVQLKWHSVEVWANIERDPSPGYYAEMVPVPAGSYGGSIGEFFISSSEISYELWQKVYKWAVSNQYCFDIPDSRGYVFDCDGDMGSMDYGNQSHDAKEPATDMTWMDAVLWCNALSELEGLTPCYYADVANTIRLKQIKGRDNPEDYDMKFPIYVDYSANGYRLPTLTEWTYAATQGTGSASSDATSAWTGNKARTSSIKNLDPNGWNIYDAIGNVWEYTWDLPAGGTYFDPETHTQHSVLGGGFLSTTPPENGSLPYGDTPGTGNFNIGFRVMRSNGGTLPPASDETGSVPKWTFNIGETLLPAEEIKPDSMLVESDLVYLAGNHMFGSEGDPFYENDNLGFNRADDAFVTVTPFYASKFEISFKKWNEVYQWAVHNGYEFDRDGDMGSMDRSPGSNDHLGEEPVTDVSWNDAVLWCNALSEYQGLDPVYYADTTNSKTVLKTANQWRLRMEYRPGYNTSTTTQFMTVIANYSKNGYRLPTSSEWEIMARAGNESQSPGNLPAGDWYQGNSQNTTHPVGTVTPNSFDICDIGGNVQEWVWDWLKTDYYRAHNPKGSDEPDGLFGKGLRGSCFGSETQSITSATKERESAGRSYIGFRVVRCDANEHPEKNIFIPEVVLKFDPQDYDPLTGQTFRNNLYRNGEYQATGIPKGPVSLKWEYQTGGPVTSSPILVEGILYIGSEDGNVYAIKASSGQLVWKYKCNDAISASPTIANDILYIGDLAGYFHAIYTKNNVAEGTTAGSRKWRIRAASNDITLTAAVFYDIAVTGWRGWSNENKYIGFDTETGEEKWRYRSQRSNGGPGGLVVDTFNVYAPVTDNNYMSADIGTEIPDWTSTGLHGYNFTPIINQDLIVYSCENFIRANNRKTGSVAWSFYNGPNTDKNQYSSPAVGDIPFKNDTMRMVMYAQISGNIFGLNALTGAKIWQSTGAGIFESSPAIADSLVYIGNGDGNLYALDARTGEEVWTWNAGDAIFSSPLPDDNALYFGCDNGYIYALTNESVNNKPTIDPVDSETHSVLEAEIQSMTLTGITDGDDNLQALSITAQSSNVSVIDNLSVAYNQEENSAILSYTIIGNTGTSEISVTVSDDGETNNSTSVSFSLTVTEFVNYPPQMDPINDLGLPDGEMEDQTIILTGITDGNNEVHMVSITASSDNTEVAVVKEVVYTEGESGGSLILSPKGILGSASITIVLTDEGEENNTSTLTFMVTVGTDFIAVQEKPRISFSPNPTRNKTLISVEGKEINYLKITDLNGRIIYHSNIDASQMSIDATGIPNGVYIVTLISDREIYSGRLIKQ